MPYTTTSPPALYYFVNVGELVRRRWVEEILLQNKVYFRQREQLNDPNELRPGIVFKGTDAEQRAYARSLLDAHGSRLPPARRLLEINRLLQNLRRNVGWEEILHELLGKIGVLCLSDSAVDDLMWAHYANGHRGIAIEFDSSLGLFAAAQPVKYTDERPVLNRLRDDQSSMLDKCMLTKRVSWSYEHEWRVVARWRDEARQNVHIGLHSPPLPLVEFMKVQHGPGHYEIPAEAVRRIILGVRTPLDDEVWVRSVVQQRSPQVPITRAALQHGAVVVS